MTTATKGSVINEHGVEVREGDFWTMVSPPNDVYPRDESWIMQIGTVREKYLGNVRYVNWKRKGDGYSSSRTIEDFGSFKNLRRSTPEEIAYFKKRLNIKD
ncbi:hypothetical protein [Psychrobacillus sp. FSL H8-0510]|uniref:hypothetical protein n=1 Tax=Psychrobacillus sp. FSL H8-0510 TaxID=2921394 RepID=UPI0030FA2C9D